MVQKKYSGVWGNLKHPNLLIQEVDLFLQDYKAAKVNEAVYNVSPIVSAPKKWQVHPNGMYKINWNAALDSKTRRIGISIIVRDFEGQVIGAKGVNSFV